MLATNQPDGYTRRSLLVQVLCWGIVVFFPLFFYNPTDSWSVTLSRFMRSLGSPMSYMMVFYANLLVLVPRLLFRKRVNAFVAANVVLIIAAMWLAMGWWHLTADSFPIAEMRHHRPRGIFGPPKWPMYFQTVIMLMLIVALSVAIKLGQRWQHLEEARKEAEKIRTESELRNLRNQLNPHFLLNTLNNIYALIAFDADKAQHAVEELSKLLRHVLYDNQQNYVPLYKEVEFMQNYIALMRIRVTSSVKIDTDISIAPDDAQPIAPLIFISLIENAFKHGVSQAGTGYISVRLAKDGDNVVCEIRNSNHPKQCNDKSGSGIGLEQVARRLEIMYPGRHTWEKGVTPDGKEYYSKIVIENDSEVCHS